MKKYLKSIISIIVAMLLLASPVYASEESMEADWHGDYTNMNLIVTMKSPVDYIQNVTVLMYPKEATPGFDTYCRVDEITVDGKAEKEIIIKLANDLSALNGEYTVVLQGNGNYDTEKNSVAIDVTVMSPGDVGTILNQINGVVGDTDESLLTLKGYLERVAAVLRLEGVSGATNSELKTVINVRNIDFSANGGKFLSLNDVEKAWNVTGLIGYLAQENVTVTQLETEYAAVSDILSIDISDEDYINLKTALYNNIISRRTSFNDNKGVQTAKDAEKIFSQAKAIAVVNSTSVDDMEDVILKYKNNLGISDSTYSNFSGKTSTDKQKILRQLVNKSFVTAEAVESAFSTAVVGTGSGSDGGGGGSSSSSDSPGSLGGVPSNAPVVSPPAPSTDKVFSDVEKGHWAEKYISALEKEGIISGYSDGSFYPGNSVKREEFVKMVVLAADMYSTGENCAFKDVGAGEWYYSYIASASKSGLVNGVGDGTFGVGSKITREDVSVIVNRILEKHNLNSVNSITTDFTDEEMISDYAKESVKNLSQIGILNGFEDGSFRPKANLTRADAAKIIFMLKEYISK